MNDFEKRQRTIAFLRKYDTVLTIIAVFVSGVIGLGIIIGSIALKAYIWSLFFK